MIYGAKYWSEKAHHYSQINNPEEQQFRKLGVAGWLEDCGPTSAVSCISALYGENSVLITTPGGFQPQPESTLADWFHDFRNYNIMTDIREETPPQDWMGNEIPQFYEPAVMAVFGKVCAFRYLTVKDIIDHLKNGNAVQACLIKPGHFISILAWDSDADEFIFNDPYPTRSGLENGGFNERVRTFELAKNLQKWGNVFYGKKDNVGRAVL